MQKNLTCMFVLFKTRFIHKSFDKLTWLWNATVFFKKKKETHTQNRHNIEWLKTTSHVLLSFTHRFVCCKALRVKWKRNTWKDIKSKIFESSHYWIIDKIPFVNQFGHLISAHRPAIQLVRAAQLMNDVKH